MCQLQALLDTQHYLQVFLNMIKLGKIQLHSENGQTTNFSNFLNLVQTAYHKTGTNTHHDFYIKQFLSLVLYQHYLTKILETIGMCTAH